MPVLEFLYVLGAFLIGLTLGSFYTALASRIDYYFYGRGRKLYRVNSEQPRRSALRLWRTILCKPSFCFNCQRRIALRDLLPIYAYFSNGGCCRYCQKRISLWQLSGECYGGIVLGLLWYDTQNWLSALLTLCFCGHLYIALVSDSRLYILDPQNTLWLFGWAIAYVCVSKDFDIGAMQGHLIAFSGALLCFGLLALSTRFRGLGLGDVLLASVIALFSAIPMCLLVFALAALMSILYITMYHKDLRAPAPLGAAMALALLFILPFEMILSRMLTINI